MEKTISPRDEAWFYAEDGAQQGPVEARDLEDLISSGHVERETLVWRDGLEEWEVAEDHFTFPEPPRKSPPPLPPAGPKVTAPQPVEKPARHAGTAAPSRSFGEAVGVCFAKYATFSGRASRSEYWYFVLFASLVGLVTGIADVIVFGVDVDTGPINSIASLALLLPGLSVAVRRLHDTDRSGWWIGAVFAFSFLLPLTIASLGGEFIGATAILIVIAWLIIFVFMIQRGTPGANRFG